MTPRHLAGHRLVAQGLGERLFRRPGLREECAALEKEAMKELLLPGFDELVLAGGCAILALAFGEPMPATAEEREPVT